jgi:hypothetical protein
MKKLTVLTLALLAFMGTFFSACTKENPVSPPINPPVSNDTLGILTGIIKDEASVPMKAVFINCIGTLGTSYYGFTDSLGKFKIIKIKPDNYSLLAFKNGYLTDTSNIVIHSKDSLGKTITLKQSYWSKMDENANYLTAYSGYNGLYINPQMTLFTTTEVGGSIGNQAGMMKTSNYGLSWSDAINSNATTSIFKPSDDKLFIFSEKYQNGSGHYLGENKLYKSVDYGNTWNNLLDFNFDQVMDRSIAFTNNNYFLSIDGVSYPSWSPMFLFYKSNDLGNSWTSYNPINNYNIINVNKTTSGKINIQNYSDSMYYTTNGINWNLKIVSDPNLRYYLRNFVILPDGKMISNETDSYYISNDDGESFAQVNSNINSNLPSVKKFVYNSNNEIYCYYTGNSMDKSGCVYKSNNNCVTMQKINEGLPEFYYVSGLYIKDDYAYLLCNGLVYRTSKKTTETKKHNTK